MRVCRALFAMAVAALFLRQRHEVHGPMPHPAQGDQLTRECVDRPDWTTKHHDFEAVSMIEVSMQARHDQVVVVVLQANHSR